MDLLERYGRRNDPFVAGCYQGDVDTGNVIKRIFQEIYLGRSLFTAHYGQEPRFYHGEGLIHRENLLMDPTLLATLPGSHPGHRHRPSAGGGGFSAGPFRPAEIFSTVITLDDCTQEEEKIFRSAANGSR